jgi:hypothetical protein
LIFPHLFAAQQSVVASAIYHWQWRNNTDEVIFFHPWRALFCLWWGLTGYRPTGSETRNDGRSSSENNARLKDESACDTSARFAFPSITGNKMSFPSFPLQNFPGALSLSLSSLPRLRLLFDCAKPFFPVYNFEGLSGRICSLFCFYPWISHGEFLQTRKFLLLLLPPLHLCFIVFIFL